MTTATGAGHLDRVGQGHRRARVRTVRGALPAGDQFCNPNSGNEKGSVENAGRVPAPQHHGAHARRRVPRPTDPVHAGALRRDGQGDAYRKGGPIGGLFAGEKMDMQPLPAKPYDAIRWEVGKADKDGRVRIDGNYYLAGPSWRGWTLDVVCAFDVTIRTRDGRTCARLPRVYGDSPATVRNPATLLPALKPQDPRMDSTIRDDFPTNLTSIDRMDAKTRRTTFRVIARWRRVRLRGRRPGGELRRTGARDRRGQCDPMARRVAAGEKPYEQSAPDLTIRRVHETPTAMGKEGGSDHAHRPPVVTRHETARGTAVHRRRPPSGPENRSHRPTIMTPQTELGLPIDETRSRGKEGGLLSDQRGRDPQPDGIMESEWMNAETNPNAPNAHACSSAAGFPPTRSSAATTDPDPLPRRLRARGAHDLDFIAGHDDLVLFGPPGTGKTHLAIALGRNACRKGIPARYFTAAGPSCGPQGPIGQPARPELAAIGRTRCSSSTNSATCPSTRTAAGSCSSRHQRVRDPEHHATTNIEFSGWGMIFGDPNMAAAIDRTVHHGRTIRFEGESRARPTPSCNNQCNNQQPAGPANAETA